MSDDDTKQSYMEGWYEFAVFGMFNVFLLPSYMLYRLHKHIAKDPLTPFSELCMATGQLLLYFQITLTVIIALLYFCFFVL